MRAASLKSKPLTESPRYVGSVTPSRVSVPLERGLEYWPAMRPTFTTGTEAAYVSTAPIWSRVLSLLRMWSADTASKASAQSPPWRRNASPLATAANRARSWSHSPAKTSGGYGSRSAITARRASVSGYSGCCAAGRSRQVLPALALVLAFTVTSSTLRGDVVAPGPRPASETTVTLCGHGNGRRAARTALRPHLLPPPLGRETTGAAARRGGA